MQKNMLLGLLSNMEHERFVASPMYKSFFLANYKFWHEHEAELKEWCEKNNCKHTGMMVEAGSDYAYTMFILRWS